MATALELTQMVRSLEARVKVLEERQIHPEAVRLEVQPKSETTPLRKMCPHCGVKPAYFFHVKYCRGQKQEKDDDRNRDPGGT